MRGAVARRQFRLVTPRSLTKPVFLGLARVGRVTPQRTERLPCQVLNVMPGTKGHPDTPAGINNQAAPLNLAIPDNKASANLTPVAGYFIQARGQVARPPPAERFQGILGKVDGVGIPTVAPRQGVSSFDFPP